MYIARVLTGDLILSDRDFVYTFYHLPNRAYNRNQISHVHSIAKSDFLYTV
jgi:hypothetical protein